MKNWRYLYLLAWILAVAFMLLPWIGSALMTSGYASFLDWLDSVYGATDIEASTDLQFFVTYVISFVAAALLTLPMFFIWNRKFPYREPTGWQAHPILTAMRIAWITVTTFLVFVFVYGLFEGVLISYSTRMHLGVQLEIPVFIAIGIAAIVCGNCYRKMSLSPRE